MHAIKHFLFKIWWKFLMLTEYQNFVKRNELIAGKYIEELRKFIEVRKINNRSSSSVRELIADTKDQIKRLRYETKIVRGRI